jgi:hypothetical protein
MTISRLEEIEERLINALDINLPNEARQRRVDILLEEDIPFLIAHCLLPTDDQVEEYIKTLTWFQSTPDDIKTLIFGNIRGFWSWIKNRREK